MFVSALPINSSKPRLAMTVSFCSSVKIWAVVFTYDSSMVGSVTSNSLISHVNLSFNSSLINV